MSVSHYPSVDYTKKTTTFGWGWAKSRSRHPPPGTRAKAGIIHWKQAFAASSNGRKTLPIKKPLTDQRGGEENESSPDRRSCVARRSQRPARDYSKQQITEEGGLDCRQRRRGHLFFQLSSIRHEATLSKKIRMDQAQSEPYSVWMKSSTRGHGVRCLGRDFDSTTGQPEALFFDDLVSKIDFPDLAGR